MPQRAEWVREVKMTEGTKPALGESGATDKRDALAAQPGEAEKVGYGRPPKHTRFKPGQSGNPRGRPKRTGNNKPLGLMVRQLLTEPITVRDGDQIRQMSRLEVAFRA